MKQIIYSLALSFGLLIFGFSPASAIYSPLSAPNNRIGIHILDPSEVFSAASLVNTSGGSWGYVTIPIRSNDRDYLKWSEFFKNCNSQKIIPIIRIATYPENDFWVKPTVYDLVDFANFLSEMPWPTTNWYVSLFNEPNHAAEWGGEVNPHEYANLIVDAKKIFKSRSENFFLLSAGLDMSSANTKSSKDALDFYSQMTALVPNWLENLDGLAFHAYPNPGFKSPVNSKTRFSLESYKFELNHLKKKLKLAHADKMPIFITETGRTIQNPFFLPVLSDIWTEPNIIAITPFILKASNSIFQDFALMDSNNNPTAAYIELQNIPKIAASPLLNSQVLVPEKVSVSTPPAPKSNESSLGKIFKKIFMPRHVVSLEIAGKTTVGVRVADNDAERERGLSGQKTLGQNDGVLFIFPYSQPVLFWMKDMLFPIDVIWINKNTVVDITKNIPPPNHTNGVPAKMFPNSIVDTVLEVNTGFIDKHNIQIGDEVKNIYN